MDSTHVLQDDIAVPGRNTSGLEHVSCIFPGNLVAWLSVRASAKQVRAEASADFPWGVAGFMSGSPPHQHSLRLDTADGNESDTMVISFAFGFVGFALLVAVRDRSAAATVVLIQRGQILRGSVFSLRRE